MKIQLFIYFLIGTLQAIPLFAETTNTDKTVLVHYSPELKKSLHAIRDFKEGKQLIHDVLKQGTLCFSIAKNEHSEKFGACWDADKRVIYIDLSSHRTEEDIIGSLIFELHNALKTSQFNHLYALAMEGKIEKENYIKSVELIEYENTLDTVALIKQGIEKKIFSKKTQIPVYSNFNDHYRYQKLCGHTAVHARSYDRLAAYNKRLAKRVRQF